MKMCAAPHPNKGSVWSQCKTHLCPPLHFFLIKFTKETQGQGRLNSSLQQKKGSKLQIRLEHHAISSPNYRPFLKTQTYSARSSHRGGGVWEICSRISHKEVLQLTQHFMICHCAALHVWIFFHHTREIDFILCYPSSWPPSQSFVIIRQFKKKKI